MKATVQVKLSRSLVRATLVSAREVANDHCRELEALNYIAATLGISYRAARLLWNDYCDHKLIESLRVKDNAMWHAAVDHGLKVRLVEGVARVELFGRTCPAFTY